jgi:hypothetical protein
MTFPAPLAGECYAASKGAGIRSWNFDMLAVYKYFAPSGALSLQIPSLLLRISLVAAFLELLIFLSALIRENLSLLFTAEYTHAAT